MACKVAMMNPQVADVPAMDNLYNQTTWNQPLSPELNSPVHAQSLGSVHSPSGNVNSPILSHSGSMPGCCSPVSVHSPNMQAAQSQGSVENLQAMDNLCNQATWNQPLSPELNSPVHAQNSPSGSPILSHAGSPMPAMPGCCSPVSVHSPNMQAAHSPVMQGSPAAVENLHHSVKQEQLDAEIHYISGDNSESLSSLLRSNEMIATQNMAMVPSHMGPAPREILDGEYF